MAIKNGENIEVEYTGTLEDGTVFDSSENHGHPLAFEVGAGQLIKGFDEAVLGLEVGEEKEITLTPDNAYGNVNSNLTRKVPRDQLPKEAELKEGMTLGMGLPNGATLPVKIVRLDDKEVTLDLNHPLAGKTLKFKIKIVKVSS